MDDWYVTPKYHPNSRLQSLLAFLDSARVDLERSVEGLTKVNDALEERVKGPNVQHRRKVANL